MIVNDKAGNLTPRGVHGFIASKLAPTVLRTHLHPTVLGHGQWIAISDDEVIKHSYIDQLQRLLKTPGQHPVSLTGVAIARWVVVTVM